MITNPFQGSGVALATPFLENGAIDTSSLRKMVAHIMSSDVDFICVLGTTAETPTLNYKEREIIKNLVRECNTKKLPLLLGAGLNCTHEMCENFKKEDFTGYDGLLLVCPFYNKPTQKGLYHHFKAASESSPLPIVLYNIPGRTGVNMEAETTLQLARDCKNIVAIKEASGNISQIQAIIEHAPEGFGVISGDDAITLDLLKIGACGVISVISNAYPQAFSEMVHLCHTAQVHKAEKIHEQFKSLYPLLSKEGNPAGLKALLSELGLSQNKLRLPLVSVSDELTALIREYVQTH